MEIVSIITPSNVYDVDKMEYLLSSGRTLDINIEVIGVGKEWKGFFSKLEWITDYCNTTPDVENRIIIMTDAYDTFYLQEMSIIVNKFKQMGYRILYSSEKKYEHQLGGDLDFYDSMGISNYKYLNTGAFIGYANDLKRFFNGVMDMVKTEGWDTSLKAVDQTAVSHYIAVDGSSYDIGLDYNCEIFYTSSKDQDDIDNYVEFHPGVEMPIRKNRKLFVKETESYPCVVHVPWKGRYKKVLEYLFNKWNT